MTEKASYSNEPMGEVKVIRDFLPPPSKLALREEGVKVKRLLDSCVEAHASAPMAGRSKRTAQKRAAV